jgi:hypothetical protein
VVLASNTQEKKICVGQEAIMRSMSVKILMVALVALVATSCATTEERSGPGADGVPLVSGVCAPDHPDCVDTVVSGAGDEGDLPRAPEPSDAPASSGFVVGGGLTITEALAYSGTEPIAIGGFIVTTADGTLLCELLADSLPPLCGGQSVTVLNPETLTGFVLMEERGTQWSPDPVVVFGHISGTDLTVASNVTG